MGVVATLAMTILVITFIYTNTAVAQATEAEVSHELEQTAAVSGVEQEDNPLSPEELAELLEGRELLRHYSQVWQMWALSNNYRHGTTVEKDLALSYAWMQLYVDSLPPGYPGMQRFLEQLKSGLSEAELMRAEEAIETLRKTHALNFRFSELQLRRAFELSASVPEFPSDRVHENLVEFPALIEQLNHEGKTELAEQLQKMMVQAEQQQKELPGSVIAYGRLFVRGFESPNQVNGNVEIGPEGYFVQVIPGYLKRIHFALTGYQSASLSVGRGQVVNLGKIELMPIDDADKAMVVGYIVPNTRLSDANVVLKMVPEAGELANQNEPWQTTLTPITLTAEGQFYAEGLSPGHYRLVISSHGQILKSQDFQLRPGQQRNIGNIQLPAITEELT